MKKFFTLALLFLIIISGCRSISNVKPGTELEENEGLCVLSFQIASTLSVKAFSMDIIGNNMTTELDIEYNDDNTFYISHNNSHHQFYSHITNNEVFYMATKNPLHKSGYP